MIWENIYVPKKDKKEIKTFDINNDNRENIFIDRPISEKKNIETNEKERYSIYYSNKEDHI